MKINNDYMFVRYMGELVQVPTSAKFMAINARGYFLVFPVRPFPTEDGSWMTAQGRVGGFFPGIRADLSEADMLWTESLRPVEQEIVYTKDTHMEAPKASPIEAYNGELRLLFVPAISTKFVNYHGLVVDVPKNVTCLVLSEGKLYGFVTPPVLNEVSGEWLLSEGSGGVCLGDLTLPEGNLRPEDSLVYV